MRRYMTFGTAATILVMIGMFHTVNSSAAEGYTVVKGDTLWSIASRHQLTVAELKAINQLSSDILSIGQQLIVTTSSNNSVEKTEVVDGSYVVKAGDSLWKIAQTNHVTVQQIRNWNNLTSDLLRVGQKLTVKGASNAATPIVPTVPADTYYIVKAGDSLWKIAQTNHVTVQQIRNWNNLTTDVLSIGQKLTVKGTSSATTTTPVTPTVSVDTQYIVKAGDSLWKISRAYGVTLQQLRSWNNLTSDLLSVGQKLVVKTTASTNSAIYIVKSGDNLWSIARRYGVTVHQLREWNQLTSSLLQVGQRLTVSVSR